MTVTNTLSKILAFAVGAAIGSAVTWKIVRDRYSKKTEEAIADMKEYLNIKSKDKTDEPTHSPMENIKETLVEAGHSAKKSKDELYKSIVETHNYASKATNKPEEVDTLTEPYIIAPEEFGECDYDTESLTYYADGVLTDDRDIPVADIENTVGLESLNSFGEYEDDSVFVRNDRLKTDYEILLDERKFTDVDRTINPFEAEE